MFIANMLVFFSLKDKKGITVTDAFLKEVLFESIGKSKKIWLDKASEI